MCVSGCPEWSSSLHDRSLNATKSLLRKLHDLIFRRTGVLCYVNAFAGELKPFRPALMPTLMNTIGTNIDARYGGGQGGSAIQLRRSLEILNAILKELMSVKLPSGLKIMGAVSLNVHARAPSSEPCVAVSLCKNSIKLCRATTPA